MVLTTRSTGGASGIRALLVTVCLLCLASAQVPVPMECSDNCTVWSHLPCNLKTNSVCQIPMDKDRPMVGPVRNLNLTGGFHQDVNNTSLYLSVEWSMPEVGHQHVTGFLVTLTDMKGKLPPVCFHLDMSAAQWKESDAQLRLAFRCIKATSNTDANYSITVLTLPNQVNQSLHIPVPKYQTPPVKFDSVSSDWKTNVSIQLLVGTNKISVQFDPAANRLAFAFAEYKVTLQNDTGVMNTSVVKPQKGDDQRISILFEICQIGRYNAKVEPLQLRNNTCKHKGMACRNAVHTCQVCKVSSCTRIHIRPENLCDDGGHTSLNYLAATIIGTCCGCFVAAALVAVLINHSKSCNTPTEGRFGSTSGFGTNALHGEYQILPDKFTIEDEVKRRPVFLLYEEDHKLHIEVVHFFACFLQKHCMCDIISAIWHNNVNIDWLLKQLEKAETIIIINSEGGFRKYHDEKTRSVYMNSPSPQVSLFVPGIEQLINETSRRNNNYINSHKKTVSVVMPYTTKNFVLQNPAELHFELMPDIPKLVNYIHRKSNPEIVSKEISDKVTNQKYKQLPNGAELAMAIDKMAAYISKNPNWFSDINYKSSKNNNSDADHRTVQESLFEKLNTSSKYTIENICEAETQDSNKDSSQNIRKDNRKAAEQCQQNQNDLKDHRDICESDTKSSGNIWRSNGKRSSSDKSDIELKIVSQQQGQSKICNCEIVNGEINGGCSCCNNSSTVTACFNNTSSREPLICSEQYKQNPLEINRTDSLEMISVDSFIDSAFESAHFGESIE